MSELVKIDFDNKMRVLCKQAGLSPNKFAMMTGLSKSFVIQIERGQRNISLDTIERIAAGLNITASELFEGVETRREDASPKNVS
ncbi:helix-turn-helix domain-containing protein [Gordonibacter sp.]|uniref:helix-turn-helix domain-containing protein n=1 Tax=Gordonibacter sp. TaxID=1968902 RepID=UPI002FC82CFC